MTSPPPTDADDVAGVQATFAATLVDEWCRAGATDAVVCPGSRSTPLALALADAAAAGRLRLHVHHDERSGAFTALGLGLATGRPAVVLTTSGTAAAELHPAVVEADLAGVPLLVCTGDRPPELRDVGAPQAVDQVHLYGRAVRWYGDPGIPDAGGRPRWRPLAARAYAAALAPPGPVHLNLPFREPLVGTPGPLPPARGGAWVGTVAAARGPSPDLAALAGRLAGRRGLVVAGAAAVDGAAVHAAAAALGWPLVAEPRSPAWGPAPTLVPHLDAVLRSARARRELRPEVVVRLGAGGSSRVVTEWLAAAGAIEVVAGAVGWSDPGGVVAAVVDDGAALVAALARAAEGVAPPAGWWPRWEAAAGAAADAVAAALDPPAAGGQRAAPSGEPAAARAAVRATPPGGTVVVSSSMPVRDVEGYAAPRGDVRVVANRGANGIDGVVSTAVGVALGTGRPVTLLIGDLAFLHDGNGLLGVAGRGVDLVCVVVDNDGGGIFSFLAQARALAPDRFEVLFGTPHGLDLVAVAAAHGVPARRLGPGDDVAGAVAAAAGAGGVHVLVVPTDREANVDAHRAVDEAVAAAVEAALAALAVGSPPGT
ncbi:MAG TPA: 2-succinyl-5-enolpyruvyl-6-hydroxy-3-cyclohexene-1-carboxylic-acid synthase [Acidimicrobiales bacterium]|nr:2-succinyl-5-enolpyruvyl-6-hydroxy-3-cyclohexene-1-carboxylic-acid synthase [Acidimicrobiales bacterium]